MNFYLGCAVWSHKDWVGNLYPPKSQPRDFLNLYSRRFTTVEGNTTFYAIPSAETIANWVKQTPPGFKFCPKLHREITHQGLLLTRIDQALAFFERMSGLGDRLGTIFMQLPPSYSPEFLPDLTEFLRSCSQSGLSLALEVRHRDWFQSQPLSSLNSLLNSLNIARVLLDTRPVYNCPDNPQVTSTRKKPQLPLQPILIGDLSFVRFISHSQQKYNQIYLEQWVEHLKSWLNQEKTVYFMVHCPQEIHSPDTARYFHSLLNQNNFKLGISTLPWNDIPPPPTQLSLF